MKGSKLLLVFILLIAVGLGAAAVWIGLRLSQEETSTTEEKVSEEIVEEEANLHIIQYGKKPESVTLEGEGVLPMTGEVCLPIPDWLHECGGGECCLRVSDTGSYEEDAGDGEHIRLCAVVTNAAGGNPLVFSEFGIFYCPTRGLEPYCNGDNCCGDMSIFGCAENGIISGGGTVNPGETFERCALIPREADCGLVQFDFMGVPNPDCGEHHGGCVGWLYYLGDECPMYCDSLVADPTIVTTAGGTIALTTSINDFYSVISGYNYSADIGTVSAASPATTATWTIPAGTPVGTYHAWVNVRGGSIPNSRISVADAGCTSYGDCTQGSEECQVSIQVQAEPQPGQPAFAANKESSVVCINDNTAARITYTITVRNISTVSGRILSVTDTYDSRFQSNWIGSFNPTPDSHSGNVLTWNNNGAGYELAVGASRTFSYVVTVPSEYFGTYDDEGNLTPYEYRNFAIVRPEVGDDIELSTEVMITCIPPTGILDNAVSATILSIFLLIVGVAILKYQTEFDLLVERGLGIRPVSSIALAMKGLLETLKAKPGQLRLIQQERFEKRTIRKIDNQGRRR